MATIVPFDRIGAMRALGALFFLLFTSALATAASKPLEIYIIDVEGGQSTLFVTPKGESLLIDTGWPGNAFRDANRIVAACKRAKVKKIDYLLITHFHMDHVGGVPQLVAKIPVGTFIDHGPNRETSNSAQVPYDDYVKARGASNHLVVKPGDHLPIKGMEAVVVSADGNLIQQTLPGAGQADQFCDGVPKKDSDPTENARSVGLVMTFGALKIVDLGDLTWNKELELMCPNNKLGKANLLIVSHHGMDMSNSPALVHALAPEVAIFDNGARKGASVPAWDTVKSSPGLTDIWQLHFADAGGKDHNTSDPFIANVTEADTGFYLKVDANSDGSFKITNTRNKFEKEYGAK
ncbi:MAG: beta-lactamase domain protein [Bryobacterales bacterium]|jgi:beta-lactamase superfamily II metal-dependent hydrolase|nr:beta-lactamase domain protein [Bryobacterales bacterium]